MLIRLGQLTFLVAALLGLLELHDPLQWLWSSGMQVFASLGAFWAYEISLELAITLAGLLFLGLTFRPGEKRLLKTTLLGVCVLLVFSMLYSAVLYKEITTGEVAALPGMGIFLVRNGWLVAMGIALALQWAQRRPAVA